MAYFIITIIGCEKSPERKNRLCMWLAVCVLVVPHTLSITTLMCICLSTLEPHKLGRYFQS